MTKENREKLFAHYEDLAENYEPTGNRIGGLYSKDKVRKNAKAHVEAMLKKNPELKPQKETKEEKPKDKKKTSKKKGD